MAKEKVDVMIRGGEATPAPPIGPSLSPLGVNVGLVVKDINEKTAAFKGMEVPVKIVVDTNTKKWEISVGTPPTTALIKKELKTDTLATVLEDKTRKSPGSIKFSSLVEIAKNKDMPGDLKARVKTLLGTCVSSGVLVDGKDPKEVTKAVESGELKVE